MCIIVDANKFGEFLDPKNDDMEPIRQWMQRSGKIAYSPTARLRQEVDNYPRFRELLNTYRRRGRVKLFDAAQVSEVEQDLEELRSDDSHVIALALVSEVKLLVSGDKNLHVDFKQFARGSIYQSKEHKHLLKRDLCP